MNLRQIVEAIGVPIVNLSRESGVSRDRLYRFMYGDTQLKDCEQQAILDVLLKHGAKVEQALAILREVVAQALSPLLPSCQSHSNIAADGP
jgi:hypothetical protein